MKIQALEVFVVGNPPPGEGGKYFVFVRLTADNGIRGVGEVYCVPFHPDVVRSMVEDVFERHVLGHNPFHAERLVQLVLADGYTQQPDLALCAVLSGLEMACWDIVGKAVEQPVYELLGGRVRERLRGYTYLYPEPGDATDVYRDPELGAARAVACVEAGFTAVKFDPLVAWGAFDPRMPSLEALAAAERYTRAVREAIGDRADILIGTHGQMTPAAALRFAERIAPFDPLWFEEPTPPQVPAEMAKVAQGTSIPIATGERLATRYAFAAVLRAGAAAILQPNLGRCGGLLEGRKIAALADVHYAQIAPHLYNGPVAGAANIQLATCTTNFLIIEGIRDWGGFHAQVLETSIRFEDGHVIPPTTPGLGVALNDAVVAAHPYDGRALHLTPIDHPL